MIYCIVRRARSVATRLEAVAMRSAAEGMI